MQRSNWNIKEGKQKTKNAWLDLVKFQERNTYLPKDENANAKKLGNLEEK